MPTKTWNPARSVEHAFDYIDLSAIDQAAKQIVGTTRLPSSGAPSRARQIVRYGDVLVSTVRPNLNGVALVPKSFHGATASTGFTVLRSNGKVEPRYLFHWVRSPQFISDMVSKATGANYPAVSDRIVRESLIPLPPIDEQRRIAAILDEADATATTRRVSISVLDDLMSSIFLEMFEASRSGAELTLREVGCDFTAGRSIVATGQDAHPKNRVIKVSAISRGEFDPSEAKGLPATYVPPESHRIRRGDILFGRASGSLNLLGATAIVDTEPHGSLFLPDKVWRLEVSNESLVTPEYVLGVLRSKAFRAYVRHHASGAAGVHNIGKKTVLDFVIRVPHVERQRLYGSRMKRVEEWRARLRMQMTLLDSAFSALQARAFTGTI